MECYLNIADYELKNKAIMNIPNYLFFFFMDYFLLQTRIESENFKIKL